VDDAPATDEQLSLGRLKDYRSLIAMAQEARKPMFKLKPGDGAIGGRQGAVLSAYVDFQLLALKIAERIGLDLPAPATARKPA
jgi:chromosome partitioning protein